MTILTIGATLYRAVEAAKELSEKYGMEAEIINLHSLVPLNYAKIVESVRKTGVSVTKNGLFGNNSPLSLTGIFWNAYGGRNRANRL